MSSRSLRRAMSASWSSGVEKKPPRSGSAKRVDDRVGQRARLGEPALLEGRLVERRAAPRAGRRGPRGRRPAARCPALKVRSSRPSGVAHPLEHERRGAARGVEVVLAAEHGAGIGQRGDHQRVPGRQALVVEARAHALRADGQQRRADPLALLLRRLGPARLEDVGALEVAALGRAEPGDRGVGVVAQRRAQLVDAPHVELALHALGVGVERAVEAALGRAHLAQGPVERLLGGAPQQRVAAGLKAVQVGARQQGVVVEHLLEVRHASSARRRCSARSRRRPGRRCRRRPSSAASAAPSAARRGRAGTR